MEERRRDTDIQSQNRTMEVKKSMWKRANEHQKTSIHTLAKETHTPLKIQRFGLGTHTRYHILTT